MQFQGKYIQETRWSSNLSISIPRASSVQIDKVPYVCYLDSLYLPVFLLTHSRNSPSAMQMKCSFIIISKISNKCSPFSATVCRAPQLISNQSVRYMCGNGSFDKSPVEIRSACPFRSTYYASEILHTYLYLLTNTSLHAAKGRLGDLRKVDLGEGVFTDIQRIDE